jgi:GT2 family glycosyltransferase
VSAIIANYSYRDFAGAAIESALAVGWLDKEGIVVDDVSTDDSRIIQCAQHCESCESFP